MPHCCSDSWVVFGDVVLTHQGLSVRLVLSGLMSRAPSNRSVDLSVHLVLVVRCPIFAHRVRGTT